jgi:antirestriction protein ArdC
MKTVQAKRNFNKSATAPKEDKFISRILENLDLVNEEDWEHYTALTEAMPTNLFTKKQYTGFNIMALTIDAMVKGFSSLKYATFKSISKAGGRIAKGSKGCIIEFFTFIYKDKVTNKNYSEEEVRAMPTAIRKEKVKKIACPKTYVVFNSQQIENLSEMDLSIDPNEEPQENEIQQIENCENFISNIIVNGNLDLRFGIQPSAFYSPLQDYVMLPQRQIFTKTSKYYSVLFHEVIHWTGHESRNNREMKGHNDQESYSFEELIAEMGAMLSCLQFGIFEEFINSVRYLKSWAKANSQDRETVIRKAFTESKRAKKYLESLN